MNLPLGLLHHRLARMLAIGVPCLLALTLGVLQYGWIRQAAVAEEQRRLEHEQRRAESAALDLRRAIEASFDDLRLVISLMRTSMEMESGTETMAERALSSWHRQTSFKTLVRGIWLMSGRTAEHIAIDPSGSISRTRLPLGELPVTLQEAAGVVQSRDAGAGVIERLRRTLGGRGFVLIWAAIGSGANGLAALEVDAATYLERALPAALKREAPGRRVTIHPASPTPPGGLLWVPNLWYAGLLRTSLDTAPGEPAPAFPWPPHEDALAVLSWDDAPSPPGGMRWWIVGNVAASTGLLLLLAASLVGVLLLFTKMRELRIAEMEFVASMSHELRLPITIVRVIGDNLSAGIVRDQARMVKYGDQIRQQTTRLSSLVEGMLLSAGLRGAGSRPDLTLFRPQEAVALVVEELAAFAQERGVTMTIDGDSALLVKADAVGFSLVLRNLVMNALLHAFPASEPRSVGIRVSWERPMLRLEVFDNGPGIPKKEQKAIFEPFARTSKSLAEQHQGSGLGLHIARRVTVLNQGSLVLLSPYPWEDGVRQGCQFVATLRCSEEA